MLYAIGWCTYIDMNLDLTGSFASTLNPTPFGIYDQDPNFQQAADSMVRYVYNKLGGDILGIELTNKQVYASLEEAMLEYSAMVNSYQAKSVISSLIGASTSSITDGRLPRFTLDSVIRQSDAYSSEALVGGARTLYSASIALVPGEQKYDLQYLLSSSGRIQPGQRVRIEKIAHMSPSNSYLFLDASSVLNYLNAEFHFESFTPETVFYMLPVWEDILRQQEIRMSERVRRSNYSYDLVNNELTIYPMPECGLPLYFQYFLEGENPYENAVAGVTTNLSNVPFSNLTYSEVNSLGTQWVRQFAFTLAKEVLGQVRSKVANVPIPNGNLQLNGFELISQAREEQIYLRNDLKVLLDATTYQSLSRQQTDQADSVQAQLQKIPLLIYVG